MPATDRLAYSLGRRDEVPNQELARALAAASDVEGIAEIMRGLWDKDQNVRSDCLKVAYEIGYIRPDLIAGYVGDFLRLVRDRNNRMVWGAMIALATVASLRPHEIWHQADDVIAAVESGTAITVVWGVRTIATVAASRPDYRARPFPFLLGVLRTCSPRDLPVHAGSVLRTVGPDERLEFENLLLVREKELSASQAARLRKVLRALPEVRVASPQAAWGSE